MISLYNIDFNFNVKFIISSYKVRIINLTELLDNNIKWFYINVFNNIFGVNITYNKLDKLINSNYKIISNQCLLRKMLKNR